MTTRPHLSESALQGAADGSLEAEPMRDAHAHLADCESCAADVARLRTVLTRAREAPVATETNEDLWPSIRSRIERSKVAPLGAERAVVDTGKRKRPWLAIASTLIAASLLVMALAEMQRWRPHEAVVAARPVDIAFASAADSTRMYEDQAKRLLNELEMQRAMMRPGTAASLDGDLAVIDRSIEELRGAIARDPRNVSLQRLLAASLREKVELLERANNAG